MGARRYLPFGALVLMIVLFVVGRLVRQSLGIGLSPASIQAWIEPLGWYAPAIFVGLVTFRVFLALPSVVLLSMGGLIFGAIAGTLLGALGVLFSSLVMFSLGRGVGRDWLPGRFRRAFDRVDVHLKSMGPVVVGLTTAHPMGPMWPVHWAAGLSAVPLLGFLLAVVVASPIRAFAYSFLGASLLELEWWRFVVAALLLLLVALLPLVHPRVRARFLRMLRGLYRRS